MEPMPETRETLRRLAVRQRRGPRGDAGPPGGTGAGGRARLRRDQHRLPRGGTHLHPGRHARGDRRPGRDPVPPRRALRRGGDVRQADGRARRRPAGRGRWQRFARAGAARGVPSSLSLPIRQDVDEGGRGVGQPVRRVGERVHRPPRQPAALFGAWPGALSNADLSFSTRLAAAASPARARERHLLNEAVGVPARSRAPAAGLSGVVEAARPPGLTDVQIARAVLQPTPRPDG